MTEQWLVFTDRETGRELAAYTVRGTFPGERAETVKLLAHDNGIAPERITTTLERRQSGGKSAGHRATDPDPVLTTIREALQDNDLYLDDATLRALARRINREQGTATTCTGVYAEHLGALAEWAERVDSGDITDDEFVELQQWEARIIRAYKGGRYGRAEYQSLVTAYNYAMDGARVVLRLDQTPPEGPQGNETEPTGGRSEE